MAKKPPKSKEFKYAYSHGRARRQGIRPLKKAIAIQAPKARLFEKTPREILNEIEKRQRELIAQASMPVNQFTLFIRAANSILGTGFWSAWTKHSNSTRRAGSNPSLKKFIIIWMRQFNPEYMKRH
ncbi:MAG: hypothetical protein QXK06_03775 [Candidatus Diapherotrites archaeon]